MKQSLILLFGLLCTLATASTKSTSVQFLQQEQQQTDQTENSDTVYVEATTYQFTKQELDSYIQDYQDYLEQDPDSIAYTIEYSDGTSQIVTAQDYQDFIDELQDIYDEMDEDDIVILTVEGLRIDYEIYTEQETEQGSQLGQTETGQDKDTTHTFPEGATTIAAFQEQEADNQQILEDTEDVIDPVSSQVTGDQYMQRVTNDEQYEEDDPVFSSDSVDEFMVGDTSDNGTSDGTQLTLVAPSDQATAITYDDLQNSDSDDMETENPDYSFLQTPGQRDQYNPLLRDEDLLPQDSDDREDDHIEGDNWYVLASSYSDQPNTGKVWTIPVDEESREDAQMLLAGFQTPTGICFDQNHNFLYVVDSRQSEDTGIIYQFEIDWDKDDYFILDRQNYVVIHEGPRPYDCSVDEYGNLVFVDNVLNEILMVGFLDLWAGFKDRQYTLYYQDQDVPINKPVAIDVIGSEEVYVVNSEFTDAYGLILEAQQFTEYVNVEEVKVLIRSDQVGWGVAYSEDEGLYYSLDDGNIYRIDPQDPQEEIVKTMNVFTQPKGLCYGDGTIFIADRGFGGVFSIVDDDLADVEPEAIAMVQGVYALSCINKV